MRARPRHTVIRVPGPAAVLLTVLCLVACAPAPPPVRTFAPDAYPARLSDWGLVQRAGNRLVLGEGVVPYEINTPLFSDYALKLRTLYLPPGTAMAYRDREPFEFPVGSIVSKTFFYMVQDGHLQAIANWDGAAQRLDLSQVQLLETRLLVRQTHGWDALPYVWQGEDALLRITGDVLPLDLTLAPAGTPVSFPYVVPARSECAGCHATDHGDGRLALIGLKARHVNRPYPGSSRNQLDAWTADGHLAGLHAGAASAPRAAVWDNPREDLAARARAYLDSNCGHCHSPTGAADTSGLLLDAHTRSFRELGVCKPPVAAGRGTGGHRYSIVPGQPDASILIYRMQTGDPATRMPEVGRTLVHHPAVDLLTRWIASLPGECV